MQEIRPSWPWIKIKSLVKVDSLSFENELFTANCNERIKKINFFSTLKSIFYSSYFLESEVLLTSLSWLSLLLFLYPLFCPCSYFQIPSVEMSILLACVIWYSSLHFAYMFPNFPLINHSWKAWHFHYEFFVSLLGKEKKDQMYFQPTANTNSNTQCDLFWVHHDRLEMLPLHRQKPYVLSEMERDIWASINARNVLEKHLQLVSEETLSAVI